jgi:hypothetical protein
MATVYWFGTAIAVGQQVTLTIGGTLSGQTFSVAMNGQVLASVTAGASVGDTANSLRTALEGSASPYRTAIGLSVDLTATPGVLVLNGLAGMPWTVTAAVTGSGATIGLEVTRAATGPNFWSEPLNWSGGQVPAAGDDVVFRDSSVPVSWGLDQSAVQLGSLRIDQSYTGRIGLASRGFATSADGQTVNLAIQEYRATYLRVGFDELRIGENQGPGSLQGSRRIKIDCTDTSGAPRVEIFATSSTSAEQGLPAVRLLFDNADAELFVRGAPAGVGVAVDLPTETSVIGRIAITGNSRMFVGDGVTVTTFEQDAGTSLLAAAATVQDVTAWGGTLVTEAYMGDPDWPADLGAPDLERALRLILVACLLAVLVGVAVAPLRTVLRW